MTKLPELKSDGSVCSRDGCTTYIDEPPTGPRLCEECRHEAVETGTLCVYCGADKLPWQRWCPSCGTCGQG